MTLRTGTELRHGGIKNLGSPGYRAIAHGDDCLPKPAMCALRILAHPQPGVVPRSPDIERRSLASIRGSIKPFALHAEPLLR